ncbi:MAG: WYL domain-containing protein [Leptospiraceae bacterium]|nr:WYL domain-containing protein [Leptospiraceae bacterium]
MAHNPEKYLEIAALLLQSEDFISSGALSEAYSQLFPEEPELDEKFIKDSIAKVKNFLPENYFESMRGSGYRVSQDYRKDYSIASSLFLKYLSLVNENALDYIFEPLTFQFQSRSLLNLVLLEYSKNHNISVKFLYTKYNRINAEPKQVYVYKILYRGRKLILYVRDKKDEKLKILFFTSIDRVELVYEDRFSPLTDEEIMSKFEYSLGGYIGGEIRDVKLRFLPEFKAQTIKEFFHKSQSLQEEADGSVIIQLKANHSSELFDAISNFLEYVEILEPEDWREEYRKKLEKALSLNKKRD